jgi:hypothetical protein
MDLRVFGASVFFECTVTVTMQSCSGWEIMMASPDMDKGKTGTLEGFNYVITGHTGKFHATTGSFTVPFTSTGTGFFRIDNVSI